MYLGLKHRIVVTITVVIALAITALFGVFVYNEMTGDVKISVFANTVSVDGQYKDSISLDDAKVSIEKTPVSVSMRLKGLSTEAELRGNFSVAGLDDSAFCAISNREGSVIRIQNGEKTMLINCKTEEETYKLYDKIIAEMERNA